MGKEERNPLVHLENQFYTINLYDREDGYHTCYYRILSGDMHKLSESSPSKILQRITSTLGLYKKELGGEDITMICSDLEYISRMLKVTRDYVNSLVVKYLRD